MLEASGLETVCATDRPAKGRGAVACGRGFRRRPCGLAVVAAVAGVLAGGAAQAQGAAAYPARPVNLVVAFPAGSGADIIARIIGKGLESAAGEPFIVNNRPGATGVIAADVVKRAAPDGYTVLVGTSATMAAYWALKIKPAFDTFADFVPVTPVAATHYLLLVNPAVPAKTVPEFIAYLKANPGKLNYGSGGIGGVPHLLAEMFKQASGTDMRHIPYQGTGPATNATIAGDVQVTFDQLIAMNVVEGGRLRALGTSSPTPSRFAPDVPPIADTLPGFAGSSWLGLFVPNGTPAPVVERLRSYWIKASTLPEVTKSLEAAANTSLTMSGEDFVRFIKADADRWREVGQKAAITLE
jgi:tripartite-type tricarboxylate transporter receptor subunit TctC